MQNQKTINIFSLISAIVLFFSFVMPGVLNGVYDWEDDSFSVTQVKAVLEECIGYESGDIGMWIAAKLPLFLIILIIISFVGVVKKVSGIRIWAFFLTAISYIYLLVLMNKEADGGFGLASYFFIIGLILSIISQYKE